ncbi:hypothetical protein [uncultured Roseibium sp.]|uniref:hypothetical protein n=1 Tax=uncultured Roseibium sp. TaxID=1936171 RepID=UPI003217CADF
MQGGEAMTIAGRHSRLPRESDSEPGSPISVSQQSGSADPALGSRYDARLALHKVLTSPEFSSVIQLRSFLNYVVSKAIEDRLDEIKGYTIAVEALGRDASFNPVTDPIVRVEAARLRRRLTKYYTGSGKHDPIVIAIPKGSYVPVFELRTKVIGSANISPDTNREPGGQPCENPNRILTGSEQAGPDIGNAFATRPPETVFFEPTADADPVENQPTVSVDTAGLLGSIPNTMRLPAAICIVFLAFIAGYALGAIL